MNESMQNKLDAEIEARAAALPRELCPERDLWPGIEQAMRPTQQPAGRIRRSAWAQAAAVLLLVAGSSGVTYLALKSDPVPYTPQILNTDNVFETVSGDFGSHFTLGNDYLQARDQLEDGLEGRLAALPTDARESVVENLNTIRNAIKEINEALAAEPDNRLLQELLLSTYHDEMSLMMQVNGIVNSAMLRDDI